MTDHLSGFARVAIAAALLGCGSAPPVEPEDVDLGPARAGFHCGQPTADRAACRALDAFAAAGPVTVWPTGDEVQVWLGEDHCVDPTASADFTTHQLVYVREGAGSGLPAEIPAARALPQSAVFASSQVNTAAMPAAAAALAALGRGEVVDPAGLSEVWRNIPADGTGAYRSLARTRSGVSVGDGTASDGIWFLRSDGTHLLLVGPTIQGGCASILSRVPR